MASSLTGLVKAPIWSISMVTVSPGLRNTGGLRAKPTPCGATGASSLYGFPVCPVTSNLPKMSPVMARALASGWSAA
jgi:hypothetical protein